MREFVSTQYPIFLGNARPGIKLKLKVQHLDIQNTILLTEHISWLITRHVKIISTKANKINTANLKSILCQG